MHIAGIQKTTLVDYPGKVAATVFLRGCNFRCGFCHNPELVLPEKFLPLISQDDFFRFLESRIGKLQGVCITGGEPLLWDTTRKLISHIKALGFVVKLDTNGSFSERLEEVVNDGDLNYIAMDVKSPFDKYEMVTNSKSRIINSAQSVTKDPKTDDKKSTGNLVSNIKKSIEIIMKSGIDYEFRTTVVKPFLSPKDFEEIGKMIQGSKRFFIQNFVQSKHLIQNHNYESFTPIELKESLEIISKFVQHSTIR